MQYIREGLFTMQSLLDKAQLQPNEPISYLVMCLH